MTTRLERLEAVAAAARTGNKRLIKLALSDLYQTPPPSPLHIEIRGAGSFSREQVEAVLDEIKAFGEQVPH